MSPFLRPLEDAAARLALGPVGRRLVALGFLLAAGWLDYVTGPQVASSPFYIPILLVLAFFEPWEVGLLFSLVAAGIYLGVDLATDPSRIRLVYPYWTACARLISFSLISVAVSHLVEERRLIRQSERALQEHAEALEQKSRRLQDTLQEVRQLQGELVERERQAAVGEAIYVATYEMERPLGSVAIYAEELRRLAARAQTQEEVLLYLEEMRPLIEKLGERALDMEVVLRNMRRLRNGEHRDILEATPDRETGE